MVKYWTLAVNYQHSVAYSRALESSGYRYNSILKRYLNKGFKSQKVISYDSSKKLCKQVRKLCSIARTKRVFDIESKKAFKFKVNFLTLTLAAAQKHSDRDIKNIVFIPFMENLCKAFNIKYYVWRAERQQNSNIHFHICTDKYIHYLDLNYMWNKAQNKLGYVDDFYFLHGHMKPNSTDVHSVYQIDNVGGYIAKYMSKNEGEDTIQGRFYSCSHALSQYKQYSIDEFNPRFDRLGTFIPDESRIPIDCEYVSMFRFGINDLLNVPDPCYTYDYINYHTNLGIEIDISGSRWNVSKKVTKKIDRLQKGNKIVYEYSHQLLL